ncbi:MAG: SRPBCC family protein [Acidimicrobiia bacterium]|nr:SRPBCC family protein [Acidimicrobiia bacterium]
MIIGLEHLIKQPVEPVFSVMSDIERRPEWVTPAIERRKLTAGEVGVGTRYQATDKYPGRRAEFVHHITAYEMNRLLGESWDGPMSGHMNTRFVAANGWTRLIVTVDVEPAGVLKLAAPLLKVWLARALRKDFARLEHHLGSTE